VKTIASLSKTYQNTLVSTLKANSAGFRAITAEKMTKWSVRMATGAEPMVGFTALHFIVKQRRVKGPLIG
jgi:hypothetical protein